MLQKSQIDPVEVAIGERIRAYRRARGLTQLELGGRVGMSFQQVQKYERAESHLRMTTILRICESLHISPNDLLCMPRADVLQLAPEITREDPAAFELMRAFQTLVSPELKRSVIRLVQAAAGPADPGVRVNGVDAVQIGERAAIAGRPRAVSR